jgi:hypothetical protein
MRYRAILFSLLCGTAPLAGAQNFSIYVGEPHVSIGIDLPVYPQFVRVPGYPVYYAPQVDSNIFFYDGLYWVYSQDRWYASTWYNGPWSEVVPDAVPLYILRVPVRYYRQPPVYFSRWAADAPPRWDVHWGSTWAQRRAGWDRWDRRSVPAAAPLPLYQRQYSGSRYPRVEQQVVLQSQQYRYQPRDTVAREYYRQRGVRTSVAAANTSSGVNTVTTVQQRQAQSASSVAPGQLKREQGAQSAREFAPGQMKKQQNAQSAREFAPGHVKKQQQVAQSPTYVPPPQVIEQRAAPVRQAPRGRDRDGDGDVDANDRGQGHGQGQGQGQGQGRGKGKGHGKD